MRAPNERLTWEQAKRNSHAIRSRIWDSCPHPIYYSVHDLSPLPKCWMIGIVQASVSCGSRRATRAGFPATDVEVAIMRTEKGALVRELVGFTIEMPWEGDTGITSWHQGHGRDQQGA